MGHSLRDTAGTAEAGELSSGLSVLARRAVLGKDSRGVPYSTLLQGEIFLSSQNPVRKVNIEAILHNFPLPSRED